MILRVTIFIVVLIGFVLLYAATKPKTFRIERSRSSRYGADALLRSAQIRMIGGAACWR